MKTAILAVLTLAGFAAAAPNCGVQCLLNQVITRQGHCDGIDEIRTKLNELDAVHTKLDRIVTGLNALPWIGQKLDKILKKNPCPRGYFSYTPDGGLYPTRCYRFSLETVSWLEALKRCHEDGGHLASPRNPHQQMYLGSWIRHVSARYGGQGAVMASGTWLAGRVGNENQYVWELYAPVTYPRIVYTNWMRGEPSGETPSFCIQMGNLASSEYGWKSLDCRTLSNFFCERDVLERP